MKYHVSIKSPQRDSVDYEIEALNLLHAKDQARAIGAKHVHPASIRIEHPDFLDWPNIWLQADSAVAHFHWCAGGQPVSAEEIPDATLAEWGTDPAEERAAEFFGTDASAPDVMLDHRSA